MPKVGETRKGENDTLDFWNGAEWVRWVRWDRRPSESDLPDVASEEARLP